MSVTHTSSDPSPQTASRDRVSSRLVIIAAASLSVGVSIAAAAAIGYFAGSRTAVSSPTIAAGQAHPLGLQLPVGLTGLPTISATDSAISEDYSIATGPVSERAEGLFVLDHNSGLLQCNVIYARVGQFRATFSVNVNEALGTTGKGGKYIMVTGGASFQGSANQALAPSVLYIMDTATGNYACFAVPYNRVDENANRPQAGTLLLVAKGSGSLIPDRENLR